MNDQILLEALRKKQRWFVENKMQAMLEHRECEELALHTLNFTRDILLSMSGQLLYNYIVPLWAMAMWRVKLQMEQLWMMFGKLPLEI